MGEEKIWEERSKFILCYIEFEVLIVEDKLNWYEVIKVSLFWEKVGSMWLNDKFCSYSYSYKIKRVFFM